MLQITVYEGRPVVEFQSITTLRDIAETFPKLAENILITSIPSDQFLVGLIDVDTIQEILSEYR